MIRVYPEIPFEHFAVSRSEKSSSSSLLWLNLDDPFLRKSAVLPGGLHAAMEKYGLKRGCLVTPEVEECLSDRVEIIPFCKMYLEDWLRP